MLSPCDPDVHQSTAAAGRARERRLAPGQAHSLRLRRDGQLQVREGRAWVTLDEAPLVRGTECGDFFLEAGQQLAVRAGRHLVIESLDQNPVHYAWQPCPVMQRLRQHWQLGVGQPLADLGQAGVLAATALVRLLAGSVMLTLLPFRRR